MTAKPVLPRAAARVDVEGAVDFYAEEAGAVTALRFIDALERAYGAISRHPGAGSPGFAHDLDLPGLRHRRLTGFAYLVFYIERDSRIDVWRVLHAHRDIPRWLQGPQD